MQFCCQETKLGTLHLNQHKSHSCCDSWPCISTSQFQHPCYVSFCSSQQWWCCFSSCRGSRGNRFTTIIRILFVTSKVSDINTLHFWWWSSCLVLLTFSMALQCWNSHNWNVKIHLAEKATGFMSIFGFVYPTPEGRIWKLLILKWWYWMLLILTHGFLQSMEQFINITAIWKI